MSCTCGTSRPLKSMPLAMRKLLRARAAACHLCPFGERDSKRPWYSVTACTVSGKPIHEHVGGTASCPEGKHPDKEGYVIKYGMRWHHTPFPDRLVLWLFHPKHPKPCEDFLGCGCIARVKLWFSKFRLTRELTFCKPPLRRGTALEHRVQR